MCGIVGVIKFNCASVEENKLIKMNNLQIHRGPDSGGIFISGNIGLGHRRLSIVDLSSLANQPLQYQSSGYYIVYNGEVYNYIELRTELQGLGYSFATSSDTEVVIASYIEWGDECFHKFNGMWAICIYDSNTQDVLLCRDRFGVKPLYYYKDDGQFLFASEKKAIVLSDFVELVFDQKGIRTALVNPFELEASGHTEFKNVYNLLPGNMIKIKKDGSIDTIQWYSLKNNIKTQVPKTFQERVQKFRELFEDACRLRLRSDVPIATSLSGGLDSSSIVAMLSRIDTAMHKTFVHSFKDTSLDETEFARIVANTTDTPMEEVEIDKNDIAANIDNIIYHFESIYGGMPDSAYRIYKAQHNQGYKISIDGHGADEMLAGYAHYLDELQKDISVLNFIKQKDLRHHRMEIISDEKATQKYVFLRFIYNRMPLVLQKHIRSVIKLGIAPDIYKHNDEELPRAWSNLKKRLYRDFTSMVLPRILKNFDAVSMSNSVEIRMPFLDYRLVEFVFALPNHDLINKNWTKYILRQAMNDILDSRVNWRKDKKGFNSPVADIMQDSLKEWVYSAIESAEIEEFCFDKAKLKQEFESKILKSQQWGDSLEFWKKINTIKLIQIYKGRKNA